MKSGIYHILNIQNHKRYIGSAIDINNRWRCHRKALIGQFHHSLHLQRAWNKYGADVKQQTISDIKHCRTWSA